MKKTLLLCFIHGFKGGEDTFGPNYKFTEDLRNLIARDLPKLNVKVLVYPQYETRGDLGDAVSRFRDWLEEKVIDLEVDAGTPSPTVEPSVRTILIGHSMGGIVAAETVIALTSEKPIYSEDGIEKPESLTSINALMFPYIQGVLAFDTPFLGISPGVAAHGAEDHYKNAATVITQLGGIGTSIWGADKAAKDQGGSSKKPVGALPPAEGDKSGKGKDNQVQNWSTWGKVVAGAAGAFAAGGAVAWMHRDQISSSWSSGWNWATSHLEFIGCLARAEELKKRVRHMVQLNEEADVGFANLYTKLGAAAKSGDVTSVVGSDRTFCNLPSREAAGDWMAAVNDKAREETTAHMAMFEKKNNPGYGKLAKDATGLVVRWLQNEWYETSEEPKPEVKEKAQEEQEQEQEQEQQQQQQQEKQPQGEEQGDESIEESKQEEEGVKEKKGKEGEFNDFSRMEL